MFQINWKLKAFLYKVFQSLRLTKSLYFIQKYITRRSKINIQKIDPHWERHEFSIRKNNCIDLLEIGAGKSLDQNIYFSYIFNNKLKQTAIDINKMIDFNLFNDASLIISNLLNLDFKGKVTNQEDVLNKYNIQYLAPQKLSDLPTIDELGSAGLIDTSSIDKSIFGTGKFFKEQSISEKQNIYQDIDEAIKKAPEEDK